MGVEFDLARHVDYDEVFFGQGVQGVAEPAEVLEEELEAVDEAAVGAEAHFFHHVFEGDEIFDVEVGFVGEVFGGGVEVYVEAGTTVVLEVGDEG